MGMFVVAATAPDRRGCDTRGLRAELLRALGAAQPNPGSTHGRGSGTCGEPARPAWQKRDSAVSPVQRRSATQHPAQQGRSWPAAPCPLHPARAPPLPLHVGVLQCLGCAETLVRGKYQEAPEEIQGLRGCVWRQEGVQRLPWPVGARYCPLSRCRLLPHPHLWQLRFGP